MMQQRTFARARMAPMVLGLALVLAACGGGGDDAGGITPAETSTGAPAVSTTTTITMRDNEYAPGDPVVAGGELSLVNEGAAPHTFTVEGEDIDVEVEAGAEASATIDLEPGTYTLFCQFHRSQGMETTLTVQ
jgi:plastocyanin